MLSSETCSGSHIIVTITEQVCDDDSKRTLNPGLHIVVTIAEQVWDDGYRGEGGGAFECNQESPRPVQAKKIAFRYPVSEFLNYKTIGRTITHCF